LEPLLDVTRDLYMETKIDALFTKIMKVVAALDVDALRVIWNTTKDSLAEPDSKTLEGHLVKRAVQHLGAVDEMKNIPFESVWAAHLIYEAFLSLKPEGHLDEFMPEDPPELEELEEPRPVLIHWRMTQDHNQVLECEVDGSMINVDAHEDDNATNLVFWVVMEYSESYGFTIRLEREVYLDPEQTNKARRVVAKNVLRETDLPGEENRTDLPVIPEAGRKRTQAELYAITTQLWLFAWELATNTVELMMGLRKGVYVHYEYIRDPWEHAQRYKKEGDGPYALQPETRFGEQPQHQWEEVYPGRVPANIKGALAYGLNAWEN
jgi:hypothetical protein